MAARYNLISSVNYTMYINSFLVDEGRREGPNNSKRAIIGLQVKQYLNGVLLAG